MHCNCITPATKKLMIMKNEDQHNGNSDLSTAPSKRDADNKPARCRMSAKANPSDSPPSSISMLSTKLVSCFSLAYFAIQSALMLIPASGSSNARLTRSPPSLSATSKSGDVVDLGEMNALCNIFIIWYLPFFSTQNNLSRGGSDPCFLG